MKFACERCGKKYATAETPVPGRVYKLKCKACGHLIVVKGAVSTPTPPPVSAASPTLTPTPTPAVLAHDRPAPTPVPAATPPPVPTPLPRAAEPTMEVTAPAVGPEDDFRTPPGDGGYVDLFADGGTGATSAVAAREPEPMEAEPELDPTPAPVAPGPAPSDDPFLAAARASLPEGFNPDSAQDPFAPIRAELDAVARAEAAATPDTSPPLAAPKMPEIPRPPTQKQGSPMVLVGVGVAMLVGILVVTLVSFGGKKPADSAKPGPVAAAPAPSRPMPAPAPVVVPAAQQPEPEPAEAKAPPPPPPPAPKVEEPPRPAPREEKSARSDREREREREKERDRHRPSRPEPKAEPKVAVAPKGEAKVPAAQPAPAAPPALADREIPREEVQLQVSNDPEELSQDQIQRVLAASRKSFDACIAGAGGDSSVVLDGRRVVVRLNIQPNGSVTYPTLDDVQLNSTALGSCLKNAARLMVFPRFRSDPLRIEVPLTMSAR